MKGTVKFFSEQKGFGFIAADDGTEYFVHQSGLKEGVTLHENDVVTFDVVPDPPLLKGVDVEHRTCESRDRGPELLPRTLRAFRSEKSLRS